MRIWKLITTLAGPKYKSIQKHSKLYKTNKIYTKPYKTIKKYKTIQNYTKPTKSIPNHTKPLKKQYKTIQNYTKLYKTIQTYTKPTKSIPNQCESGSLSPPLSLALMAGQDCGSSSERVINRFNNFFIQPAYCASFLYIVP